METKNHIQDANGVWWYKDEEGNAYWQDPDLKWHLFEGPVKAENTSESVANSSTSVATPINSNGPISANNESKPAESEGSRKDARRKKGGKKGVIITIVLLLIALIAGGAVWFFLFSPFSKMHGEKSPEAATSRFISSLIKQDAIDTYGIIAPSFTNGLAEYAESVSEYQKKDEDTKAFDEKELKGAYTFSETEVFEYRAEKIAETSSRVIVQKGGLTLDVDADILINYLGDDFFDSLDGSQGLKKLTEGSLPTDAGYDVTKEDGLTSASDIALLTEGDDSTDTRESFKTFISDNFPVAIDIDGENVKVTTASQAEGEPYETEETISFVSVQEDDQWYVDPILSIEDILLTILGQTERGDISDASSLKGSASADKVVPDAVEDATGFIKTGDEKSLKSLIGLLGQGFSRAYIFAEPTIKPILEFLVPGTGDEETFSVEGLKTSKNEDQITFDAFTVNLIAHGETDLECTMRELENGNLDYKDICAPKISSKITYDGECLEVAQEDVIAEPAEEEEEATEENEEAEAPQLDQEDTKFCWKDVNDAIENPDAKLDKSLLSISVRESDGSWTIDLWKTLANITNKLNVIALGESKI